MLVADATVLLAENLGGEGFVHVTLADGTSVVIKSKNFNAKPGDKVKVGYPYTKNAICSIRIKKPSVDKKRSKKRAS